MISGRQALGSIDQSLNQARDHITALQSQITDASERVLAQQQAQVEDYRDLARIRLGELVNGNIMQHLDSTAQRKDFENGNGSILATAPYLPADSQIDVDFDDLLSLCEDWLSIQPVNSHVKGKAR